MKGNMMVAAGVMSVLLAATACAPVAAEEANIEVTADEFSTTNQVVREVELAQGGILTVTLGSNPSTGFSWPELASIGNESVLRQTGGGGFMAASDKDVVGAPGVQTWTFEALQPGTTTLSMDYSRPWEGGEKGAWTFELTVTVK